jgi:tetratricopeptide (TPR) repeat protein
MAEGDRDNHPSPVELDRFLLGEMSPRQAAPVLAHLIRGCAICQTRMEPMAAVMFGNGPQNPEPSAQSGAEYDFPLFKALATARRYAATAATQAETRERKTSRTPVLLEAAVPATSGKPQGERDWVRCQRLIEMCRALRYSDPETTVLTATLAVGLAERLDATSAGSAALADLQASALAELGNAKRIADDLPGAEADLSRAVDRAAQGTGSPLFLAHLMDLTASLYSDQRRFEEACRLLDAVYAIYEREGDRHSAGRALISKGVSVNYALDNEDAIGLFIQGLSLIDPASDPKLAMFVIHNLIWSLIECGQAQQAARLFEQSRQLFSSVAERLDAIKVRWTEGRIAFAFGDYERAEGHFLKARESFEGARLPYEVAFVSLDMAALWLRQGRTAEIKSLLAETISLFRDGSFRREAIGMLLVAQEAFQKDQATEAMLRAVAAQLQKLNTQRGRISS